MDLSMTKQPLVIISGPTAAGKTDLSIALAGRIGAQIISADSMQVYKGFDIGTAKITPDQMQGIRHYLIDELDPEEEFNVFEFQKRARDYIERIRNDGKIPMIVGGTGFYIQAVLYDVDFAPSDEKRTYREYLEETAKRMGASHMHQMLKEVDPASASAIHENNTKRIIRALEFFHETGRSIAEHNEEQRRRESDYNFAYFVLNRKREEIYERINRRVDQMIREGLEDEVRGLLEGGAARGSLAMQGLGYKEMAAYLHHEITLEEAVYIIKRDTRHFAKRQLTWFRREKDVIWMNYEDYGTKEDMLDAMTEELISRGIIPSK